MATVTVITGPMFAGKSTQLRREVCRLQSAGKRVLVLNHKSDTRYLGEGQGFAICTHDGRSSPAVACDTNGLDAARLRVCNYDAVAVDELQFFEGAAEFVQTCASTPGVDHVFVAGLNLDYLQRPFSSMKDVLPLADHIVKLNALCACGAEAPWTVRRDNNKDVQCVGGAGMYHAVCRQCAMNAEEYLFTLKARGWTRR